ncbi:hypothetical protein PQX77_012911 [Marasmius sp. AFHP31]|nr:hypothetical protein PQX77_012911 [Marasmius sp. AFHP31]
MAIKKQLEEKYNIPVPYSQLRNRFLYLHQPARQAHASQVLLTPSQESVLSEWIELLSDSAHPISKPTIQKKAEIISGKKPGTTWARVFLKQHPEIGLGCPSGLDPKRARYFNRPVVANHCKLLKNYLEGLPMENVYNMDEKECQRGGGRKS